MKPYVKSNKNDAADAEAICEAVARPNMRFVPIKSVEQQAVLSLHRVRQGFVVARTAQANQIRGLLAEFGLVLPAGLCALRKQLPVLLDDMGDQVPDVFRRLVRRLHEHLLELDRLNCPGLPRRFRSSKDTAVQTRPARAGRCDCACVSGCRTARCNRTHPREPRPGSGKSGA